MTCDMWHETLIIKGKERWSSTHPRQVPTLNKKGWTKVKTPASNLLQDIENEIGRLVELVVVLDIGFLHLLLCRQLACPLHALHNCFCCHTARLSREVDPFPRTLRNVSSTIGRDVTNDGQGEGRKGWEVCNVTSKGTFPNVLKMKEPLDRFTWRPSTVHRQYYWL